MFSKFLIRPHGTEDFGTPSKHLGRPSRNRMSSSLRSLWHAAPLLFESPNRPIIINITSPAGLIYLFSSSYSTGKAALDRLTHDMAVELAPKNVTALLVTLAQHEQNS